GARAEQRRGRRYDGGAKAQGRGHSPGPVRPPSSLPCSSGMTISVTLPSALLVIVNVTESRPRTKEISWSPNWIRPLSCAFSPKMMSVIWVARDDSRRLCSVRRNCCAGSVEVTAFGSLYQPPVMLTHGGFPNRQKYESMAAYWRAWLWV